MPEMTYRDALTKALADELRADEDVIFFGEDVAAGRRRVQSVAGAAG